ncbi:hypothetical protein V5799_018318 [Amblyomma americanum]|uniref:DDE-1 domain-containing protein n=1 Tax=Amblyomma americanum TaxID=6943 RepID=A0AAQ4F0P6_AMBAM
MLARRSLLVLDSFCGHLTGRVKERLRGIRTDMAVIPGGLTGVLQPLDVSVNRPFKVEFRMQYSEWMANGNHDETPTGRLKRALLATVLGWILSAWNSVSTNIVTQSFKVTGISNSPFDVRGLRTYRRKPWIRLWHSSTRSSSCQRTPSGSSNVVLSRTVRNSRRLLWLQPLGLPLWDSSDSLSSSYTSPSTTLLCKY